MAVLPEEDRFDVWKEFMSTVPLGNEFSCTKADLRAAVDALDAFLVANDAAINSAIPQPARSALSVSQKARLLNHVVAKRYIKGV